MRPAQQARSRALVIRLFNEGLTLLREVDFDGLSIDALCARADSTIGAFYSRFESKEAFINALQRLVVAATRRNVVAGYESQVAPDDSVAHLLGWIVSGAIVWYRRYDGLVRASLRRAHSESDAWTPIRELGELQVTYAVPRILALLPRRRAHPLRVPDAVRHPEQYRPHQSRTVHDPSSRNRHHAGEGNDRIHRELRERRDLHPASLAARAVTTRRRASARRSRTCAGIRPSGSSVPPAS